MGISFDAHLHYALSYKEAADTLVQRVEAGDIRPDLIAEPICFLYRHFVEVMLKALISLGRQLERQAPGYPQHHRIDALWRDCRLMLEKNFPKGSKDNTEAVEKCLIETAALDNRGETFRYPVTKAGQPSLNQQTQLNLRNMREVMSRIEGFFSGSYDVLYEYLKAQADMDSDAY